MWVVVALSSLAALIVLVLCVPLDITLHIDTAERPRSRMRLGWLFGLVSKEIRRVQKKPGEKRGELEGKRQLRGSWRRIRTVLAILRTKGLVTQLKDLVTNTLSRLEIRQLGANLGIGLGDPADMVFLFAFIGPATLFMNSFTSHQIRVHPSFGNEAVFEGHLYGVVRLRPIRLVPTFMRFALSKATMRSVKTLVLTKWKNKK